MGEYIEADGLRTYYEVHGEGEPVVLLHGGLGTAESWAQQVPELARHYRVYVPERRGHGRTADVPGPITYAAMAADTAAWLDALSLTGAHLIGWSDGGAVAALVAVARPELVRKLVVIGQYLSLDGEWPSSRAALDGFADDPGTRAMFEGLHAPLSPNGRDHFPVVYDKMMRLWREEPEIPLTDIARITAPTLIMQGDGDWVRVEHSALIARTIADAQLAVVPGTSHALPLEKPGVVNRLLLDFLAVDQITRMLPVGHD
ncbi:alpha/beta fold hydrolase [Nocardia spumae]|uniref:alpha/beta fold hydrolase n=1 Tax=Nocardia spumae TaxID=2887190 RepID=UPI001D13DF96|nr:alpha/beta hydrolase [Nocardia spumae]